MTSKERVLLALSGERPDRVPFNFWMDRRLMADCAARLGGDGFRVHHFGADVVETFPLLKWPRGPHLEQDGTEWQLGPLIHDLSQLADVAWPDPREDAVYELIRRDLAEYREQAVILDVVTPWGIASQIRTFELMMTDMIDYPEELKSLLGRIERIWIPVVDRALRLGVTALYLMEDIAGAHGLLFSPEMIREFCLDFVRSLVEIARSRNIPVLWHTDGAAMPACDMLIDLGVQAINPLQPHLNDPALFRERYGGRLAVYGGLDNCYIIPEGPPRRIRNHVLDTFERLGRDGGLILSTHDIPFGTPLEHVETMVRTIVTECRY